MTVSIFIPIWLLYTLGGIGAIIILLLAVVGGFCIWGFKDWRLF